MKSVRKRLGIVSTAVLFLALSFASTVPGTLVAKSGPSGSVLYLPAGAHAAGANGASWRTDVEVHNPGSSTASFTVQLLQSGADNSSPSSRSYTLAAGRSRRFADVLVSEFGFEGAAALRVSVTSGSLVMTSRTYNLLGANPWNLPMGASFGLFEPGIAESDALSYGQEGRLIQLTQQPSSTLDGFRTNVGLVNTTASPIDVRAEFYRADGTYLGMKDGSDTHLPAYGFRQLNEVLGTWGTASDAYAIVKTTTAGGGLIAFATVIDNHNSGDPIFIPAAKVGGSSPAPTPTPTPPSGAKPNLYLYKPLGWASCFSANYQTGCCTSTSCCSPLLSTHYSAFLQMFVANNGQATLTEPVRFSLSIDGVVGGYAIWSNSSGLEPGSGAVLAWEYKNPIAAGTHTLTLAVDPDNTIAETNEGDNTCASSATWTSVVFAHAEEALVALAGEDQISQDDPVAMRQGPRQLPVEGRNALASAATEPIYVPASAHASGLNGSNWRTDLEVHNPGTAAVTYTIALLKQSTDNGGSVPTRTYTLSPQQSARYVDVLSTVFSTDGAAALRVTSQSGGLLVNSRTYNLIGTNSVGLPVGASFGQFVPGLAESEAIGSGEEGRIIQLTHRDSAALADFRSNVGFANTTASPIDLAIDLMRADGVLLATIQDERTHLRPYESKQINGIFGGVTSWLDDGYAVVRSTTSAGRFFAFATVIDNHVTGDPVFVPAVKMARGTGPDGPLTLAEAAPAIAQTAASVIVGALEGGSASASNAPVMPRAPYAQSAFTRGCPNGGSVSLGGVASSGLRYMLTNASATFVGCGFSKGGKTATMNGSLALSGAWCPGQPSCSDPSVTYAATPVGMTGNLDVSGIGSVGLDGAIGLNEYAISIGGAGLQTGNPDTPPPPNPNTCPATVAPGSVSAAAGGGAFPVSVTVGSTCAWTAASNSGFITVTGGASGRGPGTVTFAVAANTGAARTGSLSVAGHTVTVNQAAGTTAVNLTGTWTETISGSAKSNGTGTATLTQRSDNTISGQQLGLPGEVSDSITGTIVGSSVTLTEVLNIQVSAAGSLTTCTETISESLTVNSNTNMSGTFVLSGSCTFSGPVPIPPSNFSDGGRITFTR